jgi:hypothetical protein
MEMENEPDPEIVSFEEDLVEYGQPASWVTVT